MESFVSSFLVLLFEAVFYIVGIFDCSYYFTGCTCYFTISLMKSLRKLFAFELVTGTIDTSIDTIDSFWEKLSKQSIVLLCTTIDTITDSFINYR